MGGDAGHSTGSHSSPHSGRDKSKDQCKVCSGFGHHAKDCASKKSPSKSHSSQQVRSQPKENCPFCKKQGRDEVHEYMPGKVSLRLSSCQAFKDLGVEERAAYIEEIKGCALCLGWKGDHNAENCPATYGRNNEPYKPCHVQNCGKKHHSFLHGTTNAYVNQKSRKQSQEPHQPGVQPDQPSRVSCHGSGRGRRVK